MASPTAPRDGRTIIAATSLVVGPLIMAIGDLLHPAERMASAEQVAIIADHASRWYTAHLLLYLGFALFFPGLLALAALTEARNRSAGYAARILVLIGAAALISIFVAEMLVGLFFVRGGDLGATTTLLDTMLSGPIIGAVGPAMLAFFIGTATMAIPLMRAGGPLARAAALILLGVLLILAEILSARVILSQAGNILVFFGSATAGWLILRGEAGRTPAAPALSP